MLADKPYMGRKAKLRAARGTFEHPDRERTPSSKQKRGRKNLFSPMAYELLIHRVLENLEDPEGDFPQVFMAPDINMETRQVTIKDAEDAALFLEGDHPDTFMEGICA